MGYFEKMTGEFAKPYPLAISDAGTCSHAAALRARSASWSTRQDQPETAEDQGRSCSSIRPEGPLRRPDLRRTGTSCICAGRDLDPFNDRTTQASKSQDTAETIFANAKLLTDDLSP